jgi:outer membrane protein assembly factor BamE (lipoprotein component of BamABCDE complex)
VRGIQGTPTSVWKLAFTETWWYGSSYVEFDRNGRVQGYSNNGGILRIQVVPSKHSSSAYFTLGSTEDDVLSTMGTPSSIQKLAFTETWWYGSAYVEFNRNRKVQGYSNSTGNLRVVLAPKINIRSASFTIGSTKNEVLAAQGTPTSVSKLAFTETWWYGSSYVEFDTGGRVRAYSNLSGDLRIR